MITVIVPHHLDENQKYLDLCLASVVLSCQQSGLPFEILCVSSAKSEPRIPPGVTLFHREDLNNFTKKFHYAASIAHPETDSFLLVSDDVVVAWHTVRRLAEAGTLGMITNPMSNGERGSRFVAKVELCTQDGRKLDCKPDMSLEDIAGFEAGIINYPLKEPFLVRQDWVPFYCTLIPKSVWDKVGPFDESMDVRHNDQDYCTRAAQAGIVSVIEIGTFAFHFGSRTLPKCTSPAEYQAATDAYRAKYSR